MRLSIAIAAPLALAAAGLSGCSDTGPEAPMAEETAAPEGKPGVAVRDARLVLPAVPGNPAALYMTIAYTGEAPTMLRMVEIDGAERAELHETTTSDGQAMMMEMTPPAFTPGETVAFEPGGKHVMVFGLPDTVAPGATVEATLTFQGGDKVSVPARVDGAGAER